MNQEQGLSRTPHVILQLYVTKVDGSHLVPPFVPVDAATCVLVGLRPPNRISGSAAARVASAERENRYRVYTSKCLKIAATRGYSRRAWLRRRNVVSLKRALGPRVGGRSRQSVKESPRSRSRARASSANV